jgi:hypothetical protein
MCCLRCQLLSGQNLQMLFVQPRLLSVYERGTRVIVEGKGGRRAVLTVWEDRGRGLTLTSDAGYKRLIDGEDAPLVGFPKHDVVGRAEETLDSARA